MKKSKMLNKCFFCSKKYIFIYLITIIASFFSLCYYNIMNESIKNINLLKTINTYGEYQFKLENIDYSKLNQFLQEKGLKRYEIVERNEMEDSINMFVSSDFFSFSNYNIIKGRFPSNENEVMVPEWYLFQKGISEEKMLGSKIKIKKDSDGSFEELTVSGLFTVYGEKHKDLPLVIREKKGDINKDSIFDIYVETENLEVETYVRNLSSKYEWFADAHKLNYEYLEELGLTRDGEKNSYRDLIIYIIILVFIMFFVFMIMNTIYKLYFEKAKKAYAIVKLLGMNMKEVKTYLLLRTSIMLAIGELVGLILGIIFVYIVLANSMAVESESIYVIKLYSSPEILISALILGLVINLFIISREMNKYLNDSAYEIQSEKEKTLVMKQKSLLSNKVLPTCKIAYGNFRFYYIQKISLIVTIIIFIAMTVFLNYQKQEREVNGNNNDNYDYYVQVRDYFDFVEDREERGKVKEKYKQLLNILNKNKKVIYYSDCTCSTLNRFPKKYLGEKYKEKMRSTAKGRMELRSLSEYISTEYVCMGVSNEMLREMMGKEVSLKNDEVIVYNKILDMKKGINDPLNDMTGQKLNIMLADADLDTKTYKVVGMSDNICIYPELVIKNDVLCIFMSIDEFNKSHNYNYVNSFYIKEMDEKTYCEVREFLHDYKNIRLINQKEELAQIRFSQYQKRIMIYLLLILCNLMSGIGLVLQQIQELKIRLSVNLLLKKLGISSQKRNFIVLQETVVGNILGLLIGLAIAKLMLLFLREINIVIYAGLDLTMVAISIVSFAVSSIISYVSYLIEVKKETNV